MTDTPPCPKKPILAVLTRLEVTLKYSAIPVFLILRAVFSLRNTVHAMPTPCSTPVFPIELNGSQRAGEKALVHHTMGHMSERREKGSVADAIPHEYRDPHAAPLTWQLAETGELLAEVLAQLTESVATLTGTGVVVSWNAPASQLTGYTLAEINRTGFWHLFEPPQTMQELTQQARQGTRVDERLVLRRANGQHISVGVRCFPLRHLGDTEGRVVVVMRDLSELEALQDQLLQSERLSMLGRLAGAMSHELRNPLTAIFLQAEILEDELQQLHADNQTQILRS
jgi:PAS domain S-box-containing protein